MNDLEKKIQRECKEDCNVVACRFPLPNMVPMYTVGHGIDKVWVYSCKKSWQLLGKSFVGKFGETYLPVIYLMMMIYLLN